MITAVFVVFVLVVLVSMSFCTRLVSVSSGAGAYTIPVPLFSIQKAGPESRFLVFMIDELSYWKKFPRAGWKHIEQMGSMSYFSDGTHAIGILRIRRRWSIYELLITPTAWSNAAQPAATPSRPPAPDVPPVEHNGIRYSQVLNGRARNLDQSTGYLLAENTATGEEILVLKVYDVKTNPALEQDVQEIYFSSMTLDSESNSLLIEREFGGIFRVDLEKHTVVTQTE